MDHDHDYEHDCEGYHPQCGECGDTAGEHVPFLVRVLEAHQGLDLAYLEDRLTLARAIAAAVAEAG